MRFKPERLFNLNTGYVKSTKRSGYLTYDAYKTHFLHALSFPGGWLLALATLSNCHWTASPWGVCNFYIFCGLPAKELAGMVWVAVRWLSCLLPAGASQPFYFFIDGLSLNNKCYW